VLAVDRGRYLCRPQDAAADVPDLVAVRARELGRRAVVVGDVVRLVGDVSGGPDSLARIVRIEPRTSVLRRTADDQEPVERVLVANADQMAVVTSLADPPPRFGLIDRCLVAGFDAGLRPLIVLTKSDLAPAAPVAQPYLAAGAAIVVIGRGDEGRGLAALAAELAELETVLVGHSGVGKSTLVNALVPDASRRTGAVSAAGRGRHVSSSAVALPLPGGGWIVDTPGVRSFGLAHVARERLVDAFPDLAGGRADCPGDCDHLDPQVCGFDSWVAAGHADPRRLESLRHLLSSAAGGTTGGTTGGITGGTGSRTGQRDRQRNDQPDERPDERPDVR
jgi:ribosome biogenesis GTPase